MLLVWCDEQRKKESLVALKIAWGQVARAWAGRPNHADLDTYLASNACATSTTLEVAGVDEHIIFWNRQVDLNK